MRLRLRRARDVPRLPVGRAEGLAVAFGGNPWLRGLDPDLAGLFGDLFGTGGMSERIGTVDRCLQLNAQQIASMPLRYRHDANAAPFQPRWISDPDPAWYPGGIHFAIFAAVWSIYARGDAFLWVTSRYQTGFPATWTVLDALSMTVEEFRGERVYESNGVPLDAADVIQVSRNPTGALRGTSALAAYSSSVTSAFLAERYAGDVFQSTGASRVALRSTQRRLSEEQAQEIQDQWVAAVARRLGAPAILPPDLELLEALTTSPKDLMLLESREWDAKQLAAAFGVPAVLLNIALSGGLVYQAPVQLFDLWWRSELAPCAIKIQEALSRWMPRGHWCEFDPSAALRLDPEKLVGIYSKALADGAVTLDEYRAAVFDLPPLSEGDMSAELIEDSGVHVSDAGEVPLVPEPMSPEVV